MIAFLFNGIATMCVSIPTVIPHADLESKREVSTAEAKEYAESIGAVFAETSALNAQNVQSLFEAISLPAHLEW